MKDDSDFAVNIVYDLKHKTLTVQKNVYHMNKTTGTFTLYPFSKDNIFASQKTDVDVIMKLRLIARIHKFNVQKLLDYMANAMTIRPKHLTEFMSLPPYIVKKIMTFCLTNKLIVYASNGYRKSQEFARLLAEYRVPIEGPNNKEKFIPMPEYEAEANGELSWEGLALTEDGEVVMRQEIDRIKNAMNLRGSHRKILLAIAGKWMALKRNYDKEVRPRKTEQENFKLAIEEEKAAALAEEKELKKNKRSNKPSEPEYDDEGEEDPSIVRRHFRKKKVKQ